MQSVESVSAFLGSLARAMLRHPIAVVLSVAVCLAIAFAVVASKPPLYAASMTLKTADAISDPHASANRLPMGVSGTLPEYFRLMQSRAVAQRLIDEEHFDRALFWGLVDPKTGDWRHRRSGFLDRLAGVTRSSKPVADDVQQAVTHLLMIDTNLLSDTATVSCASPSRTLCAALLAAAHRQTERQLAQMLRQRAVTARDHVTRALPATTDPGMRAALTAALQTANAQIAAADIGVPMGAILLEAPHEPSQPVKSQARLMLTAAALLGLALGMLIAWWRETR
ncbi:MAG TPA: hypothetical protein VG387_11980 [Rhizomicrobium sp.]|jgi:uncharacterized protein involved in exopolysaccharide biosynthesis|nr:hypothetical protein [Rhizomicrobium sp.]